MANTFKLLGRRILVTIPKRKESVIELTAEVERQLDEQMIKQWISLEVFAIGDSTGYNQPKGMISLSATAPSMPYGYDSWRMVDIKVTDGSSHFLLSYTNGDAEYREFIYDAPLTTGSSALTTSYVALPLTNCVAPIGTPKVKFSATFTPNAAANLVYVQPTGSTGNEARLSGVVAAVAQIADLECMAFVVSGVASVSLKASAATDTCVLLVKSFQYNI